jgi:hypothetical protein
VKLGDDIPFPNAVSFPACAGCRSATRHRLRVPNPGTSRRYDVFECIDRGKLNWGRTGQTLSKVAEYGCVSPSMEHHSLERSRLYAIVLTSPT